MTLWNLNFSTLQKEPPLIRGPSTAHKGSSLMAGGGELFMCNLVSGAWKVPSNHARTGENDDVEQCGAIPYGRWTCGLFKFWHRINAKHHPGIEGASMKMMMSPCERWVNFQKDLFIQLNLLLKLRIIITESLHLREPILHRMKYFFGKLLHKGGSGGAGVCHHFMKYLFIFGWKIGFLDKK